MGKKSKYTKKQLQTMARDFLKYMGQGDPRCQALIFSLCFTVNMTEQAVLHNIKELAR